MTDVTSRTFPLFARVKPLYRALFSVVMAAITYVVIEYAYQRVNGTPLFGLTSIVIFIQSATCAIFLLVVHGSNLSVNDKYISESVYGYTRIWIDLDDIRFIRRIEFQKATAISKWLHRNTLLIGSAEKTMLVVNWYQHRDDVIKEVIHKLEQKGIQVELDL